MKRWGLQVLVLLFLMTGSGCGVSGGGNSMTGTVTGPDSKYRFTLPDLEGKPVSLNGLLANHKVVLLNFWATWCPFCIEEIPDLMKYQEQYRDKSFTVLGIDAGESLDEVQMYVQRQKINYPIVMDYDNKVSEIYGVIGLPTSILVRSDGKVLGTYHAATPKLQADIEEALR